MWASIKERELPSSVRASAPDNIEIFFSELSALLFAVNIDQGTQFRKKKSLCFGVPDARTDDR